MIVLYRKGNTHVEHGIECEMLRCRPEEYHSMIEAGCVTDPKKLVQAPETPEAPEAPVSKPGKSGK